MTKKQHKKSARRGRARPGGDNPARAIHTYFTQSVQLPRASEMCVVKSIQTNTISASASGSQAPTYYFNLNNSGISSGFWDQYRMEAVRVTVSPQNNAIGLVTNSTTSLVPLFCVIDYDDASALSSAANASAYTNCVVMNPGESCERVFQPRMALAAYGGAFTSYANVGPQWIDAASNAVQHYGVKFWIPVATAGQTLLQTWDITIEEFYAFRKAI